MIDFAILTVSDRGARGEREDDRSAAAVREVMKRIASAEVDYLIVPDEQQQIIQALLAWCQQGIPLVLTTGGTGLAPRDVTPEATLQVIEREVPGIPEAMRAAGMAKTPYAMLSRMVAGTRDHTLIINLPGSPKGVRENLEAVIAALPHAVEKLQGDPSDCAPAG